MMNSRILLALALFYSAPLSVANHSKFLKCLDLIQFSPEIETSGDFYRKDFSMGLQSAKERPQWISQEEMIATTTGPSLRGHIVNAHFQARTLRDLGVAVFDIELAKFKNFDIGWVVRKIYEKLERQDDDISREIEEHGKGFVSNPLYEIKDFGVAEYRTMLIKNLLFIDSLYTIKIDWNRIEIVFPNAREVRLDIKRDTTDRSFTKTYPAHRHYFPFRR